MQDVLTVAVVSFHPVWGDKETNLNRICGYIRAGARRGADIILLPETALTGYSDDPNPVRDDKMHRRLAEPVPGPSADAACSIAKQCGVYAVFGMPERGGDHVYNAAAVCMPDGTAKAYRKIHIPTAETSWADNGEDPLLFDTPWGPVGVGICYDIFEYPELTRYYRAKGARLVLNPCAVPNNAGKHQNESLRAAVVQSQVYIAVANVFGPDADLMFQGGSGVVGPGDLCFGYAQFCGKPLGARHANQGDMYMATIDLSYAQQNTRPNVFEKKAHSGKPDWRPDLYKRWAEDVMTDPSWQANNGNA